MGFWGATVSHLKSDFLCQITKKLKFKGILNIFIYFGHWSLKKIFFFVILQKISRLYMKICFKNLIWNEILPQISFSFWFSPSNFLSEMGKSVSKISFEIELFSKISYFCLKLSHKIIISFFIKFFVIKILFKWKSEEKKTHFRWYFLSVIWWKMSFSSWWKIEMGRPETDERIQKHDINPITM